MKGNDSPRAPANMRTYFAIPARVTPLAARGAARRPGHMRIYAQAGRTRRAAAAARERNVL